MISRTRIPLLLLSAVLLALGACSDGGPADPRGNSFDFTGSDTASLQAGPTDRDMDFRDELRAGTFTVCKVAEGSDQMFTFTTVAEGPGVETAVIYEPEITLGDGECADVYEAPTVAGSDQVTITEDLPDGWQVDRVGIWSLDVVGGEDQITFHELPAGTTEVSGAISAGKLGCVVIFYNSEIPEECTGEIGDYVWNDVENKGIQDEFEEGIPGVTVQLKDATGAVIDTDVTDADGYYLFTGLCAGDYTVCVDETTVPEGWMQTDTDVGEDDCIDNDPNPTTVTLTEDDSSNLCVDFGYMAPPNDVGAGTPGYWHKPENWPVDSIEIGGVTYSKEEATALIDAPVRGDKTLNMFAQLCATKLNLIIGTDPSCIEDTVSDADAWMADHPVESGVRANSEAWDVGGPVHYTLDQYNNGHLCAPHRD